MYKCQFIPPETVKTIAVIQNFYKYVAFVCDKDVFYKGHLRNLCQLNGNKKVFAIELDHEVEVGTDGTFNCVSLFELPKRSAVLMDDSLNFIDIDEKTGFVNNYSTKDINEEKEKFYADQSVLVTDTVSNKKMKGTIIRAGKIKNIPCYAVELDEGQSIKNNIRSCIVLENDLSILRRTEAYEYVRYTLGTGDNWGIQGNLNSCYLDTSLFAIFTFNMFLDNLIMDPCDSKAVQELQDILRKEIVFTLRKVGFVGYTSVTKFRDKLQLLSPAGKFVLNERDPEEFLEQLFKLLSPKNYFLKTVLVNDFKNVQNCFLTQLFYQTVPEKNISKLEDMLTLTFLEFEMLIMQPPKCMILQLPRDGRSVKNFKRVCIPSRLDITSFIVNNVKTCKDCSTTGVDVWFCKTCSLTLVQMTYYCKEHKFNCNHEKTRMPECETPFNCAVKMELVSILCIERSHYVAYVKTNQVNQRWMYYNSMEKIENGIFTPLVRQTNLHEYFSKPLISNSRFDADIEKIEKYAFICIYKNPIMEFYSKDFNSEP